MATNNEVSMFLTLFLLPSVTAFVNLSKMDSAFAPEVSNSLVISKAAEMFQVTDAEVNTVSKAAFDVVPLILDPEDTIVARLIALMARSLGVAKGVNNENINYDDLAFQGVALVVSVSLFSKSVFPVMRAMVQTLTSNPENNPFYFDDENAYRVLFEPVGISQMQFNVLNANGAFEWIDAEPSQEIILSESERKTFKMRTDLKCLTRTVLDNNIYWLSSGSIDVMIEDQNMKKIQRSDICNFDDDFDICDDENDLVFGNVLGTNFVKDSAAQVTGTTDDSSANTATLTKTATIKKWVKVGDQGAKILKINGEKVFDLIEHDGKLSSCIQNLVFMGVCHELRDISSEWKENCSTVESCILSEDCELDDVESFDDCEL